MSAVRNYNNDCRDCYYYKTNFYLERVDEDGRDCYKCAKCSDRNRRFYYKYGYTCSNLKEIYDVEQAQREREQKENDRNFIFAFGHLLQDRKDSSQSFSENNPLCIIFAILYLWFIFKLIIEMIVSASVGTQLVMLGIILGVSTVIIKAKYGIEKTLITWSYYCSTIVSWVIMAHMGVNGNAPGTFAMVIFAGMPLTLPIYRYIIWPVYQRETNNKS